MNDSNHIYARNKVLWYRLKGPDGMWINASTGYHRGEERQAEQFLELLAAKLAAVAPVPTEDDDCEAPRGLIYAVQLLPTQLPGRLKIGYTLRDIPARMHSYRTICPEAVLLARWRGDRGAERRVLRAISGRVRSSEVFDVPCLSDALTLIDRMLGERVPLNR